MKKYCRIIKERSTEDQRIGYGTDMKSNSCTFCRLLIFAGFFYHGRLVATDEDGQTSTLDSHTTSLANTEQPSLPSSAPTVFSTVHENFNNTDVEAHDSQLEFTTILICAVPVLILLLLLLIIFCIIRRKRRKKDKEDELPKEDVKSPIFEEDTPSVMEIEMEDLDKWMSNIKKNNNRLSTLEEENHNLTSIES